MNSKKKNIITIATVAVVLIILFSMISRSYSNEPYIPTSWQQKVIEYLYKYKLIGDGAKATLPIKDGVWLKKGPWNTFDADSSGRFSVENGHLKLTYGANQVKGQSGASFKSNPLGIFPSSTVSFSFDIFWDSNFEFAKGGKLPGVCIGPNLRGCSAGRDWRKERGSLRWMWGTKGNDTYVKIYTYTAHGNFKLGNKAQGRQTRKIMKPSKGPGISMWESSRKLKIYPGRWNTLSFECTLNTPGAANGRLKVNVNGVQDEVRDINLRSSPSSKFNNLNFVSFFGGSSQSWATPNYVQSVLFRNIRLGR